MREKRKREKGRGKIGVERKVGKKGEKERGRESINIKMNR
jgi:hypothetical protein